MNPYVEVACAIIQESGLVLAAQRSPAMAMALKWEFPGGKIEHGETPEACLIRELQEELGVEARIVHALPLSTHCYPDFIITLHPFVCVIANGCPEPREHARLAWLEPKSLRSLDWAEADVPVLAAFLDSLQIQN
ncbi:MAG: (deoxy)nucleoside triphosphate pyrophosphohydrolase [Deltaproteobacteria bacterium]|nr:(deoxy)nucleoside triphosphate pyrophosphohydrolase [Deltaproteobacteria bacterium]